jgi:hypothetical protein
VPVVWLCFGKQLNFIHGALLSTRPATEPRRFATWLIRSLSSNPWKFPCGYRPRTHGTRDSGVGDSTFRNRRASSRDRSRTAREADANCGGIVVSTSLKADRCFGRGTHAWEWAMGPIHGLPPPPTPDDGHPSEARQIACGRVRILLRSRKHQPRHK